ncbi:hypothetical protein Poli38472_004933 [Pythium oligandrum]|uniref:Uncharacterized protein n=1 Tax=Pythium oligandrum TaxID=41045 RepID=A0A8K1FGC3_PYTOL|nr:hypothetical protein Poli38472_004933 [Pythium oligandrum]|eukprot:TMW59864.1 hypothetical protein Poli38472_004933 [Pythium oligandrum]
MLRSQMMVGQRLLAMLRQDSAKKSASVDVQPCGVQSREEQDRHASELFAQVDQVFGDDVFQNEQSSFYDIRAQSNSKNGSIVDTRAGWIVACASDQVAEVLWANMTHIKGSMICKRLRMDIESQGDTLLASFTVSATAGSDHGTCTGTSLFRRHHLDDGTVVIVSVMSGQMLGTTSTSRDAITVSEEQVMRIRRVQVTDGETMTQVHITRQLRMSFAADHSTARQSIVNANIELMLLRIEDELTLKQELVEELGR